MSGGCLAYDDVWEPNDHESMSLMFGVVWPFAHFNILLFSMLLLMLD